MSGRVAVAGVSAISAWEHVGSLEHLIYSAARGALEDAHLPWRDVDAIVTAASDQIDGRAISSMMNSGAAGGHLRDELNMASSAAHAFVSGYLAIASGAHSTVLVTSWGKASEGNVPYAEYLTLEPFFDRDLPLSPVAAMAMQAEAYRRGSTSLAAITGDIVSKNRANARAGGSQLDVPSVTADEVAGSDIVSTPLRSLEVSPICDGAYSLLLTAEGAVEGRHPPVFVQGVGWAADGYRLSERDLVGLPHLRTAAARALGMAGRESARKADFVELHDYSAYAELAAYEALDLCLPGEAPDAVADAWQAMGGQQVVNPSGGSLSGEAPFGGVLRKLTHAVTELRGHGILADANPTTGLVQMSAGYAGQFQTVVALGR